MPDPAAAPPQPNPGTRTTLARTRRRRTTSLWSFCRAARCLTQWATLACAARLPAGSGPPAGCGPRTVRVAHGANGATGQCGQRRVRGGCAASTEEANPKTPPRRVWRCTERAGLLAGGDGGLRAGRLADLAVADCHPFFPYRFRHPTRSPLGRWPRQRRPGPPRLLLPGQHREPGPARVGLRTALQVRTVQAVHRDGRQPAGGGGRLARSPDGPRTSLGRSPARRALPPAPARRAGGLHRRLEVGNPWELRRNDVKYTVRFGGQSTAGPVTAKKARGPPLSFCKPAGQHAMPLHWLTPFSGGLSRRNGLAARW